MRKNFPEAFDGTEWINVADRAGVIEPRLAALLDEFVQGPQLLVEVHRGLGDLIDRNEVYAFIAGHLGVREIRISNRSFSGYVMIASNGVARGGWREGAPRAGPASEPAQGA